MNRIKDESNDKKYFVITPRLVWAKCRNPFDLALWQVVKDVAGENGECILSTPDLAKLSMMSVGQVFKSRKFLLEIGLLIGETRRDPGYPQPVFHLRVPDLWRENIDWALAHPKLADRITYKERSPDERSEKMEEGSPSERGTTPGERGTTPGERGTTPGETKNNHIDPDLNLKEHCPPEAQNSWKKTLDFLKFEIPEPNFSRYLASLSLVEYRNGGPRAIFVLAAENEEKRAWAASRLEGLIRRTLGGVHDLENINLEFVLQEVTNG